MYIKSTGMKVFKNIIHAGFHSRVYDMITQFEAENSSLKIPKYLKDEWKKIIDTETDLCNEPKSTVLSAQIEDMDKLRTEELSDLFSRIRRLSKSRVEKTRMAAEQLMILVRAYKGTQREKRAEKSGLMNSFLIDLQKPENACCIDRLKLREKVDDLETLNGTYEELFQKRVVWYTSRIQEKMKELRPKCNVCYQKACIVIEAAYICVETSEERKALRYLIDRINETYKSMPTAVKKRRKKKADNESLAH